MKFHLELHAAALAAETRLTRRKERAALRNMNRLRKEQKNADKTAQELHLLQRHRAVVVRSEARATHLALAFLRGYQYKDIERFAHSEPDWNYVNHLVLKYVDQDVRITSQKFAEWIDDGKDHFKNSHNEEEDKNVDHSMVVNFWLNKWLSPWHVLFGV